MKLKLNSGGTYYVPFNKIDFTDRPCSCTTRNVPSIILRSDNHECLPGMLKSKKKFIWKKETVISYTAIRAEGNGI